MFDHHSEDLLAGHLPCELATRNHFAAEAAVLLVLDSHVQISADALDLSEVLTVVLFEAAHTNMLLADLGSCLRQNDPVLELLVQIFKSQDLPRRHLLGLFERFPVLAVAFVSFFLDLPLIKLFVLAEAVRIEHAVANIGHVLPRSLR